MNLSEYTQVYQLMRRLWPVSRAAGKVDAGDVAANYPLWADLDADPVIEVLYALKRAGQRFAPDVAEVRDMLEPDTPGSHDWPWWHQQISDALVAYRRACDTKAPPRFEKHPDGTVSVHVDDPDWKGDIDPQVREVVELFGGFGWVAANWHDRWFRNDVEKHVTSMSRPGRFDRDAGRRAAQTYKAALASLANSKTLGDGGGGAGRALPDGR